MANAASAVPLFTSQVPLAYSNMWLYPGLNHTFRSAPSGRRLFLCDGSPMACRSAPDQRRFLGEHEPDLEQRAERVHQLLLRREHTFGASTSFVWSASIVAVPSAYARRLWD